MDKKQQLRNSELKSRALDLLLFIFITHLLRIHFPKITQFLTKVNFLLLAGNVEKIRSREYGRAVFFGGAIL